MTNNDLSAHITQLPASAAGSLLPNAFLGIAIAAARHEIQVSEQTCRNFSLGSNNRGNPVTEFQAANTPGRPGQRIPSRLQPKSHSQKTGNFSPEATRVHTSQLLRFSKVFSLGSRALLADHGLDLKIIHGPHVTATRVHTSQLLRFSKLFSLGSRALLADHGLDLKIIHGPHVTATRVHTSQLLRFSKLFSLGSRALLADHGLDFKILHGPHVNGDLPPTTKETGRNFRM